MSSTRESLLPPAYGGLRPPGKGAGRSRPRRAGGRRRAIRVVAAVAAALVVLVGGPLGWSAGAAYLTPGNESFSAKWADWLRGHGAAGLVDSFESYYYSSHAPPKGGRPRGLNPVAHAARYSGPLTSPSAKGPVVPSGPPLPTSVPLVVSPPLPGEGQWQPVGPSIAGRPGMFEAQFRADEVYTSEITTAVWMDPTRLRISLVPGRSEPGGSWTHPAYITPAELPRVLAAFNGGFRFQDAHGGFYLDGRTAIPLRAGAASLVLYGDGRVDIGAWGSEVSMTPGVVAVLQNLVPMVDHGQVSPSATYDDHAVWGQTLNTSVPVARSGVGITADGALVYVAGPALTARSLAEALQRVGAVRGMTLDINPEWVTFNVYTHTDPANPAVVVGTKLYPQMQRSADRYLPPTHESRDFFEVSLP